MLKKKDSGTQTETMQGKPASVKTTYTSRSFVTHSRKHAIVTNKITLRQLIPLERPSVQKKQTARTTDASKPSKTARINPGKTAAQTFARVKPIGTGGRKKALLEIQQLQFALVELQLYLDTHSFDELALAQYNQLAVEFQQKVKNYEKRFGPLLNFGFSTSPKKWKWVNSPWPWQL